MTEKPPCEVSLPELSYISLASLSCLFQWHNVPEQGGRQSIKTRKTVSLKVTLSCLLARVYKFIPENSIFPAWAVCIFTNDGE